MTFISLTRIAIKAKNHEAAEEIEALSKENVEKLTETEKQ
jgi:hypothetical protein